MIFSRKGAKDFIYLYHLKVIITDEIFVMECKLKHLDLIQGVINRMASNSFSLKNWTVVLVSASFALAAKFSDIKLILIAFLPASAFWLLDGYFLRQERLYRKLYDRVRKQREDEIDFSMNATIFGKDKLEGEEKQKGVDSWLRTCFSWTLFIFYGLIFLPILVIAAWIVFDINQIFSKIL